MQSASPGTRSGATEMASDWAHRRRRESLARGRKNGRTEMMRLLPPHLVKQDEHPAKPEPRGFEDDNGSPRSESGCEYTKPDAPCPTWPRSAMSACEAHNGGTRVRTYVRTAKRVSSGGGQLGNVPAQVHRSSLSPRSSSDGRAGHVSQSASVYNVCKIL